MFLLPLPWHVLLAAAAVSAALPLLWWARPEPRRALAPERTTDLRQALLQRSARERTVGPLAHRLAEAGRRLTPHGMLDSLERRVTLAGRPASWPIERVLAAKLLLGLGGLGAGLWFVAVGPSSARLLLGLATGVLGFVLPDILLQRAAAERALAIQRALPDTLDQISICMEAGLGFESALAQAASGRGALSEELVRTLQEIQMGVTRREAFQHLAGRTSVDDVRHLVLAINQGEAYGVPIADILHGQAGEQRVKRRQRAEERAMKMPVKVVFPLVFCILPTLFIVLLGPGAIRIAQSFMAS